MTGFARETVNWGVLSKIYAKWMFAWETALTTRDTNRIVRPLEWGFDWLPGFSDTTDAALEAERSVAENLQRMVSVSDAITARSEEFFGYETPTDFRLVEDFPLLYPTNVRPETLAQDAELKRQAARGKAHVDLAFWGAVVPGNASQIQALAQAGVKGFKCFLTHPGTDEFQMVTEADLREAMPKVAQTGLPLLAHAEISAPILEASAQLDRQSADWRRYETYLRSRPPEAELG